MLWRNPRVPSCLEVTTARQQLSVIFEQQQKLDDSWWQPKLIRRTAAGSCLYERENPYLLSTFRGISGEQTKQKDSQISKQALTSGG